MTEQNKYLSVLQRVAFLIAAVIYSCSGYAQQTQVYWGDTHLHTSNSTDAYENGLVNASPESAYRFARGLPIIHPATQARVQIDQPLDFLLIADHAEMLQLQQRLANNDPLVVNKPAGQRMKRLFDENPSSIFGQLIAISLNGENQDVVDELHVPEVRQGAWFNQIEVAERHNIPHTFTALLGWEWSSSTNNINKHRVVFTADGSDVAKQFLPFSSYDSDRPEDLWAWLEETTNRTGARLLAMPHNSNISDGQMFDTRDSDGRPITSEYAKIRERWEPVMEVTQYKGTSEIHPALSTNDEFANFEIRNELFGGAYSEPNPGSYARTGLLRGLEFQSTLGTNPYKFGLIGSTDSHTGLVSVEENNFFGKSGSDILPETRAANMESLESAWKISATGLSGVWAKENTREGLFEAFQRKEVYATTGPRISLRFFGGFNYEREDANDHDFVSLGYSKGVAMGGDLTAATDNQTPNFIVEAVKDPLSANLDRVQIIKGWLDGDQQREKIYDISWSNTREIDSNGKLPSVGNTVDLNTATYTNTIGETVLRAYWQDPDFNKEQLAFYYIRVLEIPTPRHHVYDAVALGIDPLSIEELVPTLQERAYSSPIWYTP